MRAKRQITSVYVFPNGMVVVFDQHGQQMPKYQGEFAEKAEAILRAYNGPVYSASNPPPPA